MVTHATSTVRWAESDKRWEEGVRIRGGKEDGKMEVSELAAPPASELTRWKSEGPPALTQPLTSLAAFNTWPQTYSNLGVHSHPPLPGALLRDPPATAVLGLFQPPSPHRRGPECAPQVGTQGVRPGSPPRETRAPPVEPSLHPGTPEPPNSMGPVPSEAMGRPPGQPCRNAQPCRWKALCCYLSPCPS